MIQVQDIISRTGLGWQLFPGHSESADAGRPIFAGLRNVAIFRAWIPWPFTAIQALTQYHSGQRYKVPLEMAADHAQSCVTMAAQPPIYVVSLPRCTERRRIISARLVDLRLDFSIFDATDGEKIDPAKHALYARRRRRLFFGKDLTRGEFGCLLSHRAVYRHMVDSGIERALVLEDDAVPQESLPGVIAALMQTPVPWDIVRFLHSAKSYRKCRAVAPLCGRHALTRLRTTPGGAYGYMLNRRAAHRLLERTQTNWLPVDIVHGQVWRTGLEVFSVRPSPVLPDHDVPSTIGGERFVKGVRLTGWEKGVYPLTRAALKIYESAGKAMMNVTNRRHERGIARAIPPLPGDPAEERPPGVPLHARTPDPSR
jgi:glycosyl transferase family 25